MEITFRRFTLTKRHALTISRGTFFTSENLLVSVWHDGLEGVGEMAPTSGGNVPETAETAEQELIRLQTDERFLTCSPWEMQRVDWILKALAIDGAARAAVDMAMHDWQGKRVGLPVWQLFGLERKRINPTSVTIGMNPPDVLREIVPEILARTGTHCPKVKLGSPQGIEADKAMFAAIREAASPFEAAQGPLSYRVDANGGWSVEGAREMLVWLKARGVEYVEQPLKRGQEADLPALFHDRPLPIFVDESVYLASDVPKLAPFVDGVNLKLMKCGGLREALRIIHTARAHGLQVMIGCMAESSLAISAGAQIASLVDYVDLDSNLNLVDDPFVGATYENCRVMPNELPGLGVTLREGVEL